MYSLFDWKEGQGMPHIISLAISCPRGVANAQESFSAEVADCCTKLRVKTEWPIELATAERIHCWVPKLQRVAFHPRMLSCENFLSTLRTRYGETIKVECDLPLPFKVLKKIKQIKRNEYSKTGSSYLYIDLEEEKRSNYMDDDGGDVVVYN